MTAGGVPQAAGVRWAALVVPAVLEEGIDGVVAVAMRWRNNLLLAMLARIVTIQPCAR